MNEPLQTCGMCGSPLPDRKARCSACAVAAGAGGPNDRPLDPRNPPPIGESAHAGPAEPDPAAQTALAEARYRTGLTHRAAGELDEAVRAFADALLRDAAHRDSLRALGETLLALGRPADALRAFERGCRIYPDDAGLRSDALEAERRLGRSERRTASPPTPASGAGLLAPRHSRARSSSSLRRAKLLGLAVFLPALVTYVLVGLAVHWTVGLASAAVLALGLAAASTLLFPGSRAPAFRAILGGVLIGVGAVLFVGLISVVIALSLAFRQGG